MKKVLLSGLLAGFAMLLVCMGLSSLVMKCCPTLISEYDNTSLYRSMKDPITMLFSLHPFILAMILAFVWDKSKSLFTAKRFLSKGMQFGLIYFVIVIPGLFISYVTSPYSIEMIFSWAISVLLGALVAGMIFEKVNA
jgi:hypothetical protein